MNYPPGMKESEIPGIDNPDPEPISRMDQWYIDMEDHLDLLVYEVYIQRMPHDPEQIAPGLPRQINDDAYRYFKTGIDPESAADLINEKYERKI